MKKTAKYFRFENMKMELQQKHPKEVSRAVMCFKDFQGNIFKTKKYGEVTPNTIQWEDALEIPFTNQQSFKLETICEHQYGYDLEELEAMYNGQIYIKTQNFFRPLTTHIFNSEGQKCGILRYLIKVIEKQIVKTAKKQQPIQEKPAVHVQLIGKINVYAASLSISIASFKKQKYSNEFDLTIEICGQRLEAHYKKNYEWGFVGAKVQYMEDTPQQIIVELRQNNELILSGQTNMQNIIENKRFVTHSITVYNVHEQKVGVLKIDMRFITKQQLLDLMYSPTKLTKNKDESVKLQNKNDQLSFHSKKTNMESSRLSKARVNSSMLETARKKSNLEVSASHNVLQTEILNRGADRYKKVLVNNGYNEIIFSKAKRFSEPKNVNPHVSYSDPSKLSDFSPEGKNPYSNRRMADISASKKFDFTRQYKGNPGVGEYKLPSIWDKY